MAKKKQFEDPLEGMDPIMEQAFSDFGHAPAEEAHSDDMENSETQDAFTAEKGSSKKRKKKHLDTISTDSMDLPDIHDDLQNELDHEQDYADISDVQFPVLNQDVVGKKVEMDVFGNIPVSLSVELGRSQISLKEVFELSEGSIIELERLVGEPLDLVVNGQVVAQGEVVAIDSNYGFRVTTIISTPQ